MSPARPTCAVSSNRPIGRFRTPPFHHEEPRPMTVNPTAFVAAMTQRWGIRPWLFIRQEAVPYLLPRLPAGQYPRITYLEETAFPWEYEAVRQQGKEPGKPHTDFDARFQE